MNRKIIEFFGLSHVGKTYKLLKLEAQGKNYYKYTDTTKLKRLFYFIVWLLKHPYRTAYLFYKMNLNAMKGSGLRLILMRNSFLAGVLAKSEILNKRTGTIYTEDLGLQSLFAIFHKKTTEKEVIKVINMLPIADKVMIIEADMKLIKERFKKGRYPYEECGEEIAKAVMEVCFINYPLFKKVIEESLKVNKNENSRVI